MLNPLDPKMERSLHEEMRPTEKTLWSAAPAPARFSRRTLPIVLFGIPWTAFAVFWITAASGFKRPAFSFNQPAAFFPLFGLPFVLIGIGMLSSPYWARRKARRTVYAITNERALILSGGWRGNVSIQSFQPHQLSEIRRVQTADGSGDVIFDRRLRVDGEGSRQAQDVGFFGIPDVKMVEGLILTLSRKAK